jgi:hypothetical protein
MRRGSCKLGLVVIFGVMMVFGCGGGGIEEMGQRYTSSMFIEDNGSATLDIDVIQSNCGTIEEPEAEPFTNVFALVTVGVSKDALGLSLQSYSVAYIPVLTPDGSGNLVRPPDLVAPGPGTSNFELGKGQTSELEIVCMDIDTKEEYVNKWLSDPALVNLDMSQYIIRVTLHFKDAANHNVTLTTEKEVNLGNFNNC